jgi:hypothetical protein
MANEKQTIDEWEQPLVCPIDPDLLEECEVCS